MKYILSIILFALSFTATAQSKIKQDSVIIKLTHLQEQKIADYEKQIKALQEKTQDLFLLILDMNKIDEKKVTKVDFRPGEMILRLKP